MRSVSSQISWVNSRAAASASCSKSCAAPRMPESGFFTSCASIAAMAVTERAAFRWVSWRSILSAIERSCSVSTRRSGPSPAGAPSIVTERGRKARAFEQDVVFGDRPAALPHRVRQREERALRRDHIGQRMADQSDRADPEKLLGGRIDKAHRAGAVERRAPDWGAPRGAKRRRAPWPPARLVRRLSERDAMRSRRRSPHPPLPRERGRVMYGAVSQRPLAGKRGRVGVGAGWDPSSISFS